jgi:ATP-dependent Clp protease ATP-binding subunit ClpA
MRARPTWPRTPVGFNRIEAGRATIRSDQQAVHAGVPQPSRRDHPVRQPAGPEVVYKVVEKFVMQLEVQLADRGVTFELSKTRSRGSPTRATTRKMGARPLGRVIQEHIKRPLADEVLFGKLKKGGMVKVSVSEDGNGLLLESIEERATPPN